MNLLDCGCGPGSITLGLAEIVAPGQVIGIDLDASRIEQAKAAAQERGIPNVSFQIGDAYKLPFPDHHFDAAFQNAVFIHLKDPLKAAREIYRVIRPGGLFGARETDHDSTFHNGGELVRRSRDVWHQWQKHQGSNHYFSKHLRATLREAGFQVVGTTASCECYGTPERMSERAELWERILQEPEFVRVALEQGWADEADFDHWRQAWREWAGNPDAVAVWVHVEAVAQKPT